MIYILHFGLQKEKYWGQTYNPIIVVYTHFTFTTIIIIIFILLLPPPKSLCLCSGLFVGLFVCLSARLWKNYSPEENPLNGGVDPN